MTREKLDRFSHAIIRFYEALFSWEQSVAKSSGLSPQRHHTIDIVGHTGPIRMKPLARKLGVTTGTLTAMVQRLERSGYLIRERDPRDHRGFNIALTPKGRQVHQEHHGHHLALTRDILNRLSRDQASAFAGILEQIPTAFEVPVDERSLR